MRSVIALLGAAVLYAQPDGQWDSLASLRHGQQVNVVENSMKSWSGRFVSANAESITIRRKDEKTIPRASVYRVSTIGHSRNALIGLAIGAGAGIGLGAAIVSREEKGYGGAISEGAAFGLMTGLGAVAGALVGYCIPSHKTLYRAQLEATPKSTVSAAIDPATYLYATR